MLKEFVEKIISLAPPTVTTVGAHEYSDKNLNLVIPPAAKPVEITTLQGLADLFHAELDNVKTKGDVLLHVTDPTAVEIVAREADDFGRRHVFAKATYPAACKTFPFGQWLNPEQFVIAAQMGFQRVLIETGDDGKRAQDLDYVLQCASAISNEAMRASDDDGISQTVTMKQGIHLKGEQTLKARVNLAPYRTFAEIDQVVSLFIFRARPQGDDIGLALFEADGGRWRLDAVAAIVKWLAGKFGDVPVIS